MRCWSRLAAPVLPALALAVLSACGDAVGPSLVGTETPSGQLTPLAPAPRAEGTLGQKVILGDTGLLLSNLQDPFAPEDAPIPVAEDQRLVALDVEISNEGATGELAFAAVYFTAIDNAGQHVYVPYEPYGTTLGAGSLAPGEKASGRVVFAVPKAAVIDSVRYKPFEERDLILVRLSQQ